MEIQNVESLFVDIAPRSTLTRNGLKIIRIR